MCADDVRSKLLGNWVGNLEKSEWVNRERWESLNQFIGFMPNYIFSVNDFKVGYKECESEEIDYYGDFPYKIIKVFKNGNFVIAEFDEEDGYLTRKFTFEDGCLIYDESINGSDKNESYKRFVLESV